MKLTFFFFSTLLIVSNSRLGFYNAKFNNYLFSTFNYYRMEVRNEI